MPTYKWDHGFAATEKYDGQPMTIIRPALVPDEADEEVGPMFLVRFEDGETQFVYVDEIAGPGVSISTTVCDDEDCPGHVTLHEHPGQHVVMTNDPALPFALVDDEPTEEES